MALMDVGSCIDLVVWLTMWDLALGKVFVGLSPAVRSLGGSCFGADLPEKSGLCEWLVYNLTLLFAAQETSLYCSTHLSFLGVHEVLLERDHQCCLSLVPSLSTSSHFLFNLSSFFNDLEDSRVATTFSTALSSNAKFNKPNEPALNVDRLSSLPDIDQQSRTRSDQRNSAVGDGEARPCSNE
jgi:hypothetical protein